MDLNLKAVRKVDNLLQKYPRKIYRGKKELHREVFEECSLRVPHRELGIRVNIPGIPVKYKDRGLNPCLWENHTEESFLYRFNRLKKQAL